MIVEAHWSVLKQLYILSYNQPRIDIIVFMLDTRIMVTYRSDYELIFSASKTPFWWKLFVWEWKSCMKNSHSYSYFKIPSLHICSYQICLCSRFFLCNHLVGTSPCPQYMTASIRRSPLFIEIDENTQRLWANVDEEQIVPSQPPQEPSFSEVEKIPLVPLQHTQETDNDQIQSEAQTLIELFRWFESHIDFFSKTDAGSNQVSYVYRQFSRDSRSTVQQWTLRTVVLKRQQGGKMRISFTCFRYIDQHRTPTIVIY